MLVAQNSLGPVCPVPLTVRGKQLLGEIQILKAQAQNTDAKLDAILKHLNIETPPPTAAATVMHADSA